MKVTVDLWIDEDDEPRIADAVSGILTEQMQSAAPHSALLDWEYSGGEYPGYIQPDDHWAEDPDYPHQDWAYEVMNNDTRLGYWEWVRAQKEATT